MSIPFTVTGSVSFPPETGAAVVARAIAAAGNYDAKHDDRHLLVGAATKSVVFDSELKLLVVSVESGAVAPVNLRFNGGVEDLELAANGLLLVSNPTPGAGTGILQVDLISTLDATVRIIGLG